MIAVERTFIETGSDVYIACKYFVLSGIKNPSKKTDAQ